MVALPRSSYVKLVGGDPKEEENAAATIELPSPEIGGRGSTDFCVTVSVVGVSGSRRGTSPIRYFKIVFLSFISRILAANPFLPGLILLIVSAGKASMVD